MLTVTGEMRSHISGLSCLLPSAFRQIHPIRFDSRKGQQDLVLAAGAIFGGLLPEVQDIVDPWQTVCHKGPEL